MATNDEKTSFVVKISPPIIMLTELERTDGIYHYLDENGRENVGQYGKALLKGFFKYHCQFHGFRERLQLFEKALSESNNFVKIIIEEYSSNNFPIVSLYNPESGEYLNKIIAQNGFAKM